MSQNASYAYLSPDQGLGPLRWQTDGMQIARATHRTLVAIAVLAIAVGCGAPTVSGAPSPASATVGPSTPPVLGIDWARAASVERPTNFAVPSDAPEYEGTHPILRIPGQAMLTDVIGRSGGGFAAVGYVPPDWVPAAWTSADGATWSLHAMGETTFTFPVAIARGADGTLVAVGRSGNNPVAWTSLDGVAWEAHAVLVLDAGGDAERMTTVVASEGGFVAGGSAGPELFERHARFWTSVDGVTLAARPR